LFGEYIRERFPLVPTETLKETLDRAILVATATFLQLAVIEVNQAKEVHGNSFIN